VRDKLDRKRGVFWLIYSDLSENLGLVPENNI